MDGVPIFIRKWFVPESGFYPKALCVILYANDYFTLVACGPKHVPGKLPNFAGCSKFCYLT